VPRIIEQLAEAGRADVLVMVGGIIPEADIPVLKERGVAAVFTPGAPLESIGSWLESALDAREAELAG
jgi:methylmalonyl-CoA mutase C-terminal domain/subunit